MIRYPVRTLIVTGLCTVYGCATGQVAAPQAPPAVKAKRATAAAATSERIAVLEFEVVKGIDIDRLYFSDKVRGEVGRRAPKIFVMTRESTEVLLKMDGRQVASDCEGECEVESGKRLGADYVVSGRIAKLGSRLVLTMRLHSTGEARLLRAVEAIGKDTDSLVDVSQDAVDDLLLGIEGAVPLAPARARPPKAVPPVPQARPPAVAVAPQAPTKGAIKMVSTPPGGRVLIDGIAAGKTPMVKELVPNTYWVTIEKEGFNAIERTVELAAGQLVLVSDTFHKEVPKPETIPVVEERRVCREPVGSFVQSCRNIVVRGCRLTADCAHSNGVLVAAEYDLSFVCADLSNCEGRLVCGPCR